jgi:predicted Rossmann fold nucleotide-binding protein DprA/Smf involved in DNA uptake
MDGGELVLAAYAAETGGHFVSEPQDTRYARFRERFDGSAFRERLAAAGIRWLLRSDPDFPAALRSIFDPPPCLFLRGAGEVGLLDRPAAAIVGARACSSYGAHVARTFGRELAAAGLVVVSGLARGIDGEAHRGALDAGAATVAVLGCGVDRDYPAAHAELARRICLDGLIVSEYAPGVEPAPWRFPARKREGPDDKPIPLNHRVVPAVGAAKCPPGVVPVWSRNRRLIGNEGTCPNGHLGGEPAPS